MSLPSGINDLKSPLAATGSLPGPESRKRAWMVALGLGIFAAALGGLFYYKWSGSLVKIRDVQGAGQWMGTADGITSGGLASATLFYFNKVWLAMLYGILIGAAVRALISPRWVARLLAEGGAARRQVVGSLAGAPLMLCSCCVTPIFSGVYERGARMGSALAVMLAAPGLNPAALVLTFLLFPLDLSLARLCAALAAVLLLPLVLEHLFGGSMRRKGMCVEDEGPRDLRDFLLRFGRSLLYLTALTVPMIAAGVVLSSLLLPLALSVTAGGAVLALLLVSLLAVLVALPTFFEIPLALLLLELGLPGAAVAILFAGPIINLPSLFVLARETNVKVAGSLCLGIWLLAVAAGAAVMD